MASEFYICKEGDSLSAASEEPPASEEPQEPTEDPQSAQTQESEESEEPEEPEAVEEEEEEYSLPIWRGIPRYYQTDYPLDMYGPGTIAENGCSITCLAMVASYMTDQEYTPDQLARYFGGKAQNNMKRMEYGATAMKLSYFKSSNYHETMKALRAGKVAIALMNKKSLFTESQHFIVLCGLTEEGNVMVYDPYQPNETKWNLVDGFENGFHPDDILYGYSGAWIFDKSAMPSDPYIYYEPERDYSNSRYPDFQLTDEDLVLLAKLIWCEARGESYAGQQAVAEIVFNRMMDPEFPSTVRGNIFGEGQFRTVDVLDKAQPNQTQYDAILDALAGPNVIPEDVFFFAREPLTPNVWGRIGGHVFCYR